MIQVNNLKKKFGTTEVLKGITTEIDEREVVCVIGLLVRAKAPSALP